MGRHRDEQLLNAIEAAGQVCALADLGDLGIPVAAAQRLKRAGHLHRLTGSCFATTRVWEAANPWDRFRLQTQAVGRSAPPSLYLGGWAAAVVHGLPVLGSPPPVPVGIIPGDPHRSPQRTPYFRYRHGWLPEHRQLERDGIRVIDEAYAAVDVARHHGRAAGLVVADQVLTRGGDAEDLGAVCENLRHYPGVKDGRWCADHASERSESPVETLGRWAFLQAGRPAPLANVWLWSGRTRYRGDLFLPDLGVVLEADGAVKYNNRADADRVIKEQIAREEQLRFWGLVVVRYTFAEAWFTPDVLVRRADRAALLRPDEPLSCRWSLDPPWAR